MQNNNVIFVDFETFYDSKAGYTLSKMSYTEYVKDPRFKVHGVGLQIWKNGVPTWPTPRWITGKDIPTVFSALDWDQFTVCAHNMKFDGSILNWIYGVEPKQWADTVSMSKAVLGYKVEDHHLRTVAAYFGLAPKGTLKTDGVRDLTSEQEKELGDYCVHDTDLCATIYGKFLPEFPVSQFRVMDWVMRCFFHPDLELDTALLQKLNDDEKARRTKIFEELRSSPAIAAYAKHMSEAVDPKCKKKPKPVDIATLNVKGVFSSNAKFPTLLKVCGYEVPIKSSIRHNKETGETYEVEIPALAVSDDSFQEMLNSRNEELKALAEARVAAKSNLLETRSAKYLKVAKFGRWSFDINFSGAQQTHRFSGGSGGGGNPQNLTRGSMLRQAVKAPDGYQMLVADYDKAELRVQAWLAGELGLMSLLTEGKDIYCDYASKFYRRPITKADKAERQFGKTCMLGLGYGMGPDKFKYRVKIETGMIITDKIASDTVDFYRSHYYRIKTLWAKLNSLIPLLAAKKTLPLPGAPFLRMKDGNIVLPSGLVLRYPNLRYVTKDGDMRGEWIYDVPKSKSRTGTAKLYGGKMLENISQALVQEITKVAILRCEDNGLHVAGQNHDELIAISRIGFRDDFAVMKRGMEDPMPWWPALNLKAEIGVGPNWKEAKA